MRCPKCQFDHELQTTECLKCGIVFARYQAALDRATKQFLPCPSVPLSASARVTVRNDALRKLKYRILAVPLALILARFVATPVCDLRQPCSQWCCTKVGTPSLPG